MSIASPIIQPSKQMEQTFITRTHLHRRLVRKNLLLMQGYLDIPLDKLKEIADKHDKSKFKEPERIGYIWMTWKYHCHNKGITFDYPDGIANIVFQSWQHHIHNNSHHPEAHSHPNAMSQIDMIEMVCDWTAISQENNPTNGSCLAWASINMDKKWNFSLARKDFIFATIHELEQRKQQYIHRVKKGN